MSWIDMFEKAETVFAKYSERFVFRFIAVFIIAFVIDVELDRYIFSLAMAVVAEVLIVDAFTERSWSPAGTWRNIYFPEKENNSQEVRITFLIFNFLGGVLIIISPFIFR